MPAVNMTNYKKGAHCMGCKIYNQLPNYIKDLANNEKIFKKILHRFLIDNVFFYSMDEFLNFNENSLIIIIISICIEIFIKIVDIVYYFYFYTFLIN